MIHATDCSTVYATGCILPVVHGDTTTMVSCCGCSPNYSEQSEHCVVPCSLFLVFSSVMLSITELLSMETALCIDRPITQVASVAEGGSHQHLTVPHPTGQARCSEAKLPSWIGIQLAPVLF